MVDPKKIEDYMDIKEAAEHFKVAVSTVRRWVKRGGIHYYQPSGPYGVVFIPRSDSLKIPQKTS